MRLELLSIVFLTNACGVEIYLEPKKPAPSIDETFREFYQDAEVLLGINPNSVGIKFGRLAPPTVGECSYDKLSIVIDSDWWANEPRERKQQLVFHELGHCVLSRGHDDESTIVNGLVVPRSIMARSLMPNQVYVDHLDYYLDELVNPVTGSIGL